MSTSIFLDIETLSTRHNAVIISFAAIAVTDGVTIEEEITLHPCIISQINLGRHICQETIAFHAKRGTLPDPEEPRIDLNTFARSIFDFFRLNPPSRVWIQGPDFDAPILSPFFTRITLEDLLKQGGAPLPWDYWKTMDARTCWNIAFPGEKHPPRPHTALEDCKATLADTIKSLTTLNRLSSI